MTTLRVCNGWSGALFTPGVTKQDQQTRQIESQDRSCAGEDQLEYINAEQRINLAADPEKSTDAPRHYKKHNYWQLDEELKQASVVFLQFAQHNDSTQCIIAKAAMKEQTNTAPIIEETRPTMYSLPSINNLLYLFSSFHELASVSYLFRPLSKITYISTGFLNGLSPLTGVNNYITKIIVMLESWIRCCLNGNPASSLPFALVNTSSKYPGTEWPVPAGICVPVSCCRLEPDIALKERHRVSQPTWHW
jgi:hypothetical protein